MFAAVAPVFRLLVRSSYCTKWEVALLSFVWDLEQRHVHIGDGYVIKARSASRRGRQGRVDRRGCTRYSKRDETRYKRISKRGHDDGTSPLLLPPWKWSIENKKGTTKERTRNKKDGPSVIPTRARVDLGSGLRSISFWIHPSALGYRVPVRGFIETLFQYSIHPPPPGVAISLSRAARWQ